MTCGMTLNMGLLQQPILEEFIDTDSHKFTDGFFSSEEVQDLIQHNGEQIYAMKGLI